MSVKSILILNGPNLNLLGQREPEIYGRTTLAEIEALCRATAAASVSIDFRQSNHEGELVEWIQQTQAEALILNAAAYTHTSVAIHDALKNYKGRLVEVHLSNPHKREPFRHSSYVSPLAEAVICGMGARGYTMAIEHLCAK
jgi:3-dehydroquinate dehydratase II